MRGAYAIAGAVLGLAVTACANGVTTPSSGALVLFDVEGERFRIWLDHQEDIDAARRVRAERPRAFRAGGSCQGRSSMRGGAGTWRTSSSSRWE